MCVLYLLFLQRHMISLWAVESGHSQLLLVSGASLHGELNVILL